MPVRSRCLNISFITILFYSTSRILLLLKKYLIIILRFTASNVGRRILMAVIYFHGINFLQKTTTTKGLFETKRSFSRFVITLRH